MDAKERLRLYLEQRRELGEYDLVLDKLPVEDVLAMLGAASSKTSAPSGRSAPRPRPEAPPESGDSDAARNAPPAAASDAPTDSSHESAASVAPPPPPAPRFDPAAATSDWRSALRAAESASAPDASESKPLAPKASAPKASSDAPWLAALGLPAGLSVHGTARTDGASSNAAPLSLDALAETIAQCTACALHASATHAVPGEGDPNADLLCVGEAPGQQEDESGRPFVGPSGELLTKILAAIDMPRDTVFICNVLKHRPPANRNPAPDEVRACRPFLEQQLAAVKPRVIVAFGTFAAQTLLETTESLSALRGRLHRYHGIPLIVTYHPAALLRNAAWKRPTWEDVQLAKRVLDASREARPS